LSRVGSAGRVADAIAQQTDASLLYMIKMRPGLCIDELVHICNREMVWNTWTYNRVYFAIKRLILTGKISVTEKEVLVKTRRKVFYNKCTDQKDQKG
jgi:hypothetical protein